MKLILTRHGETEENLKGIIQGHLPGKLSKNGIEQTKKLAIRLKNEKLDAIYSSDLARAADTAREIAKFHPAIPIKFVKELREVDTGKNSGKHVSEVDFSKRPDYIESRESMRKRAKKILEETYKKYCDGTILFVGHRGINKTIMRIILGKPIDFPIESSKNTSISIFEIAEDKKNKIHLLDCIKHLE